MVASRKEVPEPPNAQTTRTEQLLWREIGLGHVTDGGTEREEINPEAFIRQSDRRPRWPDVLRISAVDLVTLAEVGQFADKLTFRAERSRAKQNEQSIRASNRTAILRAEDVSGPVGL